MNKMAVLGNNFEVCVPYKINEELLSSLNLKELKEHMDALKEDRMKALYDEIQKIKTESGANDYSPKMLGLLNEIKEIRKDGLEIIDISSREILNRIVSANYIFSVKQSMGRATISYDEKSVCLDMLHDDGSVNMLCKFLEVVKATGDLSNAVQCSWYYYGDKYFVKDDASSGEIYPFFVCHGEEIVVPTTSIMSGMYPENMFIAKNNYFYSNEKDTDTAFARVLYKKWMQETTPGKVQFEKQKMEVNQGIFEFQSPLLVDISGIKKELNFLKWLLIFFVGLFGFATLYKP